MDNKLSELSKPVAWTDREELAFVNDMACMWTEGMGINEEPLYSQEYVSALLAELEREIEMRAQNLEIKTLLAKKVKGLETKLWDSQQLVDAKSSSQIELRSKISSIEESNRKYMAWRGERLCELEDSLEAAQKRIAELEAIATEYAGKFQKAQDAAKHLVIMNDSAQAEIAHLKTLLATPVRLPELCGDGENDNEYTEGLNDGINQSAKAVRAAGFKCVGDE